MARHGASLRAGLLQGVTFGVRGVAAVVHLVPGVPPFFGVGVCFGGADVVLRYDRCRVAARPVVMGACQGGNV